MPYNTKEKRRENDRLRSGEIKTARKKRYKLWRLINPEGYRLNKANIRQRMYDLKLAVLTRYGGGKCACSRCGESRLACLSIDHINGKHTAVYEDKTPAGKIRHGRDLYCWLKAKDYPDGYQTLCMNCQWVKRYENGETGGGRNGDAVKGV